MVSELQRHVWCDVCATEDTRNVAVWESPVQLDGPALQVDLCAKHEAKYIDPLRDLLRQLGRKPDQEVASKPRLGRPPKSESGKVKDGHTCPLCGLMYSDGNLPRHMRKVHGAVMAPRPNEAPQDVEGPVCPECGQQFQKATGLGAHRRAKHGVKGGSSTAARHHAAKQGRESQLSLVETQDAEVP